MSRDPYYDKVSLTGPTFNRLTDEEREALALAERAAELDPESGLSHRAFVYAAAGRRPSGRWLRSRTTPSRCGRRFGRRSATGTGRSRYVSSGG